MNKTKIDLTFKIENSEYFKNKYPYKTNEMFDFEKMGKQMLAMRRINQALNNGTLIKSNRCMVCNRKSKLVAHHYNGYDKMFDVWWICYRCNANLKDHTGKISLKTARKIIINRYFKKPLFYQKWRDKQKAPCFACCVEDLIGNMIIISDHYDCKIYLCHHCAP